MRLPRMLRCADWLSFTNLAGRHQMTTVANRDAAVQSLEVARAALFADHLDKAQHFAKKAMKLSPSDEVSNLGSAQAQHKLILLQLLHNHTSCKGTVRSLHVALPLSSPCFAADLLYPPPCSISAAIFSCFVPKAMSSTP